MIFNCNSIKLDAYGVPEYPSFMLTTLADSPICPLNFYGLNAVFRYNDVSEFTFTVPATLEIDGQIVDNPCYEEVRGQRLIDAGDYGIFVLVNPKVTDDGIQKVKECTAYSLEYTLNNYMMPGFDDETLMLADPTGMSDDDLMSIVLDNAPGWKLLYVSPTLSTRYRTLSDSGQTTYAFLMNTLQNSYNCIVLFDTRQRGIMIYDMDMAVDQTGLFLDNENVIVTRDGEELSDEIVTALAVYGADDISIRPVNVLASDYIYNLSYFCETGDIPEELAAKWYAFQDKNKIYQKIFSDLYSQYYNDVLLQNNEYTALVDLQGELESMQHVMDTYQTDTDGDHSAEIAELQSQMTAKQTEIDRQQAAVDSATAKTDSDQQMMQDIVELCSFEHNFTAEEYAILQRFFKESSIQETTFVDGLVSEKPAAFLSVTSDNPISITIDKGDLYRADDYADLTDEEWAALDLSASEKAELQSITNNLSSSYIGHHFFQINSGYCDIANTDNSFNLYGTVVNSTVSYAEAAEADGTHQCMVSLSIDNPCYNGDEVSYTDGLLVLSGYLTNFAYAADLDSTNTDTMSFVVTSGILTLTADSSINQRVHMLQELYDYGVQCLDKLSSPAFEFEVEAANFLFAPEYEFFRKNFELGKKCWLEHKPGYYIEPIFLECEIDYDSWPDLQLRMSNKIRYGDPAMSLADTIGDTAHKTASLDASKYNYSAFKNSNIQNDVEILIESALDLAKKSIIDSANQSVLIDSQGIHLRKTNPATGLFDPGEIRLINNKIVFTNDSWKTASMAIGQIETPDGASTMGVVAQSLIGEVLIGNKLLIEATNPDANFGGDVTHFRVDAGGVKMANGAIYIQGSDPHNQIIIDPMLGIMAGDNTLFKMGDSKFELDIYDEFGNIKYDQDIYNKYKLEIPTGAKFYFDINTGNLVFRGDVYANNGYFKGTVNADAGYFKGSINVNDQFIVNEEGHVTANSANITGNIKATTLDCTGAQITGLSVGENGLTMSPHATISWGQVTGTDNVANKSDIPDDAAITQITQDSITTGTLKLGGNIYKISKDVNWWGSDTYLLFGKNQYGNLQVGSPSSNADYENLNLYAKNNIYMLPGGASIGDEDEASGGWTVCIRNHGSDNRGVAVHGTISSDTAMYVSGKKVLTSSDISADGSLNVVAIFG
jgi:uncharacterized protein YlxW (UPF0749 family)